MKIIIVSGRSGAGKSVALSVLEDAGFYCVDNLPVNMLHPLVASLSVNKHNIAVSIDVRNLPNDNSFPQILEELKQNNDVTLLYLNANESTLLKRYSETRRLHPLSMTTEKLSLEQAVRLEKNQLVEIKEIADLTIDSSSLSLHDLSEALKTKLLHNQKRQLLMVFESFGFKYGVPKDSDYVFDVRFLPNPHWIPELRQYTGLEQPVIDYLSKQPDVNDFQEHLQDFIQRWLPLLEKNNRSYVTVAIGCTGGKHRSVYLTQKIGEYFQAQGLQVKVRHTKLFGSGTES